MRQSNLRQTTDVIIAKLFTKSPWLLKLWSQRAKFIEFYDSPWTPLTKETAHCRLALITTGGVHLKSNTPFDMNDPLGDPTYREIPYDAALTDLIITHNYYDHRDADKDINIVLPIQRVRELAMAGDIGEVNYRHFAFMGHISKHHINTLIQYSAPAVAAALIKDSVDIVLLTPA